MGWGLRLTARRRGLVLVYHAVGAANGNPARELVPPHGAASFEAHLRHLVWRYRVVAADDLLAAAAARRRGARFPVAVTFDDDALAAALTDGREALEGAAGERIDTVAYPHGRADARVAAAARAAGFRFGFTGRPDAVDAQSDPLLLGRLQPTYRSAGAFALQLVRALARRG